jgi:endogenous inhibitor of DNA gyrase (YacG/DUF329 family)
MEVNMPEQAIKITCPHCGKIRTINPAIFGISKGPPSAALEKAYQKKREKMMDAGHKSGSWISLKCPGCGRPYQYNPRSHQVRVRPA